MTTQEEVLLIEDDPKTRKELTELLQLRLPVRVVTPTDLSLKSVVEKLSKHPDVSIILLDLILQKGVDDFNDCALYVQELRRVNPNRRIIGYSHILKTGQRKDVIDAGADDYVAYIDVYDAVVARVYFQAFLADLGSSRSPHGVILEGLGAGVSVQDPETWEILYTNPSNLDFVGKKLEDVRGRKCWQVYHGFKFRDSPCTTCVAAAKVSPDMAFGSHPEKGMILPIRGKLEKVRVVAALIPANLYGYPKQLVAEVSQRVGSWLEDPADVRLHDALRDLWAMTSESATTGPCEDVAIYYSLRTKIGRGQRKTSDYVRGLFDSVTGIAPASLGMVQWPTGSCTSGWVHSWPKAGYSSYMQTYLYDTPQDQLHDVTLVYVCAAHQLKDERLFACDFNPYWEFIISEFPKGLRTRLDGRRMAIGKAMVEFRAKVSEASLESDARSLENLLIGTFAGLAHGGLGSISSHFRKIDTKGRRLLLVGPREGVYATLAHEERSLYEGTMGSAWSFVNGAINVNTLMTFNDIAKGLMAEPTQSQRDKLEQIVASVDVPVRVSGHLWGVASFQFDNDYLAADEGLENVRAMTEQLGTALTDAETKMRIRRIMDTYTEIQRKLFEESPLEWLPNALSYILMSTDMAGVGLYFQDPATKQYSVHESLVRDTDLLMPGTLPLSCNSRVLALNEDVPIVLGKLRPKSGEGLSPDMKLGIGIPVGATAMLVGLSATDAAQHKSQVVTFENISRLVRHGFIVEAYRQGQKARVENLRTANAYGHLLLSGQKQELMVIVYGLLCLSIARDVFDSLFVYWIENEREFFLEFSVECLASADAVRLDLLQRRWTVNIPSTAWAWRVKDQTVKKAIKLLTSTIDVNMPVGDILSLDRIKNSDSHSVPQFAMAVSTNPQTRMLTFCWQNQSHARSDEVREALKLMSEMLSLHVERCSQRDLLDQIVRGKSYAWRTKSVLLTERVTKIAGQYQICPTALSEIVEAIDFFKRSGDISAAVSKIEMTGLVLEEVLLTEVASECIRFVADERISLEITPDDHPIRCDRNKVRDVLLELISNARKFTPCIEEGGRIVVRARHDLNHSILEVEDNGSGVSPQIEDRLFEAFFSDPPVGVGMGLYYCRKVMEQHGGEVTFARAPLQGSVFRLVFPLEMKDERSCR